MAATQFPFETDQPRVDVTLPLGTHVLELRVVDSAGSVSEPDRVTIVVERVTIGPITPPPPFTVGPITRGPITVGPITRTPITVGPITRTPITVGPITRPPVTLGPLDLETVTPPPITDVADIGRVRSERLTEAGIADARALAEAKPARVAEALDVSEVRARGFIEAARRLLEQ